MINVGDKVVNTKIIETIEEAWNIGTIFTVIRIIHELGEKTTYDLIDSDEHMICFLYDDCLKKIGGD